MNYSVGQFFQSMDRSIQQAGKSFIAPAGGIHVGVIYGPFGNKCMIPAADADEGKRWTAVYMHPDCTVRCQFDQTFNEGEAVFASGGVIVNFAAAGNLPCVGMVLDTYTAGDGDSETAGCRILFTGINTREVDGTMNYA